MKKNIFLQTFFIIFISTCFSHAGENTEFKEIYTPEKNQFFWNIESPNSIRYPEIIPIQKDSQSHQNILKIHFKDYKKSHIFTRKKMSFSGWDQLEISFFVPKNHHNLGTMIIYALNHDGLWFQTSYSINNRIGELHAKIPLTGKNAVKSWKPSGHKRPWSSYIADNLKSFGLKFFPSKGSFKDKFIYLRSIKLTHPTNTNHLKAHRQKISAGPYTTGKKIELSTIISSNITNPYKNEITYTGTLITPDKKIIKLQGFYYEDFILTKKNKKELLIPYKTPEYKIRFLPTLPGQYTIQTQISLKKEIQTFKKITFHVTKDAAFKGFLRASPKDVSKKTNVVLQFDNGEHFFGIGLNVRSPYDKRYKELIPFSNWQDKGLFMYKELFAKYKKTGINVIELWMASWWLGLEWSGKDKGLHGIGYYNQYRAWKLDLILKWAKEYDIYIILVINNHGNFSTFCDKDWQSNPYNSANGGWLTKPEDYFSDNRAKKSTKQLFRYISARWSYSPNILTWKLFTEINLTGPSKKFHLQPRMVSWHKDMSKFLQKSDPNNHFISTHWCDDYRAVNPKIVSLDSLNLITLDAYLIGRSGKTGIFDLLNKTNTYAKKIQKPVIITEYGGSPFGAPMSHLKRDLHFGLWQGFFNGFATTPFFWWFPLVEEQNLYYEYERLNAFIKGETNQGFMTQVSQHTEKNLTIVRADNKSGTFLWLNDNVFYKKPKSSKEAKTIKSFELIVTKIQKKHVIVTLWDYINSKPYKVIKMAVNGNKLAITLPDFKKDIMIKIK